MKKSKIHNSYNSYYAPCIKLIEWLTDWLFDWLIDGWIDGLIDWSIDQNESYM